MRRGIAPKTFAILYCMLTPCLARTNPAKVTVEFGVGFNLALDYGTVGIRHENGSAASIAKVEGSPQYREMMRSQRWCFAEDLPCQSDSPEEHDREPQESLLGLEIHMKSHGQGFRDYLPPWLGGRKRSAEVVILTGMLRALKTAAESYMGSEVAIADAEIVFPARPRDPLRENTQKALSDLSIRSWIGDSAGLHAARETLRHKDGPPPTDRMGLVLTVDHSRAALTAILFAEDSGYFEDFRGMHNASYGTENGWSAEKKLHLLADLRHFVRPVESAFGRLDCIKAVVVLGEAGGDRRIRDVLKEALEESKLCNFTPGTGAGEMLDPVFAAAQGAASTCLWNMQYEEGRFVGCLLDPEPQRELR